MGATGCPNAGAAKGELRSPGGSHPHAPRDTWVRGSKAGTGPWRSPGRHGGGSGFTSRLMPPSRRREGSEAPGGAACSRATEPFPPAGLYLVPHLHRGKPAHLGGKRNPRGSERAGSG